MFAKHSSAMRHASRRTTVSSSMSRGSELNLAQTETSGDYIGCRHTHNPVTNGRTSRKTTSNQINMVMPTATGCRKRCKELIRPSHHIAQSMIASTMLAAGTMDTPTVKQTASHASLPAAFNPQGTLERMYLSALLLFIRFKVLVDGLDQVLRLLRLT